MRSVFMPHLQTIVIDDLTHMSYFRNAFPVRIEVTKTYEGLQISI
jgi:hypothetical protein